MHYFLSLVVAVAIKLLKWPPTDSDTKRTIELKLVPTAPSLEECKEIIKKVHGIMSILQGRFRES